MLKVYDYKCPDCGATQERFVDSAVVDEQVCSQCTTTMERVISCPQFHLDGTDPDFPGAWNKWAVDKERRARKAKAYSKEHGDTSNMKHV